MSFPIITFEDAIKHAKLDAYDDLDLTIKVEAANAVVMKHLKLTEPPDEWIVDESASPIEYQVPADIKGKTLIIFGALWQYREHSGPKDQDIPDLLRRLFWSDRDPTLA